MRRKRSGSRKFSPPRYLVLPGESALAAYAADALALPRPHERRSSPKEGMESLRARSQRNAPLALARSRAIPHRPVVQQAVDKATRESGSGAVGMPYAGIEGGDTQEIPRARRSRSGGDNRPFGLGGVPGVSRKALGLGSIALGGPRASGS
jgi:hypothetical protein